MSFTIPLGAFALTVAFSSTGSVGAGASLQFFKDPFQVIFVVQALLPFDLTLTFEKVS